MEAISTTDTLRRRAEIIRDETQDLANTAERVGQLLVDMVDGGSSLEIIELNDLTLPTDENIFSSLRTLFEINSVLIEANDMFLRKDIPDTAHEAITFDKKIGSSVFLDGMDGKGWEILETGTAIFENAHVRSDIFIGGRFGSVSFASGFTGWGVEIEIPTASATFDHLTVRKSMKVYELVYSQIYGLGGSVIISDLNKILYVETCQGFYRCYMDSMDSLMRMNLRKDDIVRMQRSSGINIRYFYGEVLAVTPDYFDLKITDGEDYPQLGDVVFRFGNKTDKNRQGIIYLTSSDDKAPYIDVLDGITDMSMFEKIKVRMGNLSGIRTKRGVQLNGYGIYAQGAVFEDSDIYLQDGTTVEQQFIIMNGKFESTIEGIRNDMSLEAGNILRNSSFGSSTHYWTSMNTVHFMNIGGSFLWMDGSFYVDKQAVADIYRDGSKNVLRIRNAAIIQSNTVMTGEKAEGTYSFAFYYKVIQAGKLIAGVPGTDLYVEQDIPVISDYQKLSKVAQWDGTGDFKLQFTGEILIYGVSLFNDALADAQIELQTQIDQTSEYIKLLATKDYVDSETGEIYIHYDSQLLITAEQMSGISTKVEGLITQSSGWITRAEGTTIFAKKDMENGKSIVNAINVGTDGILIAANRINLYGAVSFSMLSDYSNINNIINGKANSSSLGDLAYQDYVYSYDLASDITNTIASKVSPGQLRNYAFANGAEITKSDFINDLQTEINAKMVGSATASGNKLASVIINGQTLIAGGYIQANLINVDELWCTSLKAIRGTIGGYEIKGNRLYCTPNDSSYGSLTMYMDSSLGELGISGNSKVAYLLSANGQYSTTDGEIGASTLYIRKSIITTRTGPEASAIKVRLFDSYPCTFLDFEAENNPLGGNVNFLKCSYAKGQRTMSFHLQHFPNDDNWIFRTCIKASMMPSVTQIDSLHAGGNRYHVMWDEKTGLYYFQ